jgi:hypothetical protein
MFTRTRSGGARIFRIVRINENMTETTANYDLTWKEAINDYFPSFIEFFFPTIYELIDWTETPISLDTELQQISQGELGEKSADKLYQVRLKNRSKIWILIHLEVQSQYDKHFPKRMFIYNYRAFDLYGKPVVSLAILGDEKPQWRPSNYSYGYGKSQVSINFEIAKLLDYEAKWESLERSENPFSKVVMAHLKTKATTKDMETREEWKWRIVKGLYEQGLSEQTIIKLHNVIDKMMTLPEQLQNSFERKLINFEEEKKMPLMSNIEEKALVRGTEKGKQEGKQEGVLETERNAVIKVLKVRFKSEVKSVNDKINQITDLSLLEQLLELAVTTNSLTEFEEYLQQI